MISTLLASTYLTASALKALLAAIHGELWLPIKQMHQLTKLLPGTYTRHSASILVNQAVWLTICWVTKAFITNHVQMTRQPLIFLAGNRDRRTGMHSYSGMNYVSREEHKQILQISISVNVILNINTCFPGTLQIV